jgi:beta-glucanase (GH16 family)
MHWKQNNKHASLGDKLPVVEPWKDFHLYAVEWSADKIDVFYDDKKYFTFNVKQATENGDNAFRKPMYLILNLALGGSWGKTIDDSIMPQQYWIDYVRVYQKAGATTLPSR